MSRQGVVSRFVNKMMHRKWKDEEAAPEIFNARVPHGSKGLTLNPNFGHGNYGFGFCNTARAIKGMLKHRQTMGTGRTKGLKIRSAREVGSGHQHHGLPKNYWTHLRKQWQLRRHGRKDSVLACAEGRHRFKTVNKFLGDYECRLCGKQTCEAI